MRLEKERFFEDLQEKNEVYGNEKVQELLGIVIDKHYKKVQNDEIVYDDDLLLELSEMVPEMSLQELHKYGMTLSAEMQMMMDGSYEHEYMMLDRLQQDCEYFLGAGQRNEKHLWTGNVSKQIIKMEETYNKVPIKPEWLSYKDILHYEAKMTTLKTLEDLKDLLDTHEWKIYEGENYWDIEQYTDAGEDFIFSINHDNSLEKAVKEICEYAENFDQDEHISIFTPNENGCPGYEELLEDAKDIQGMLDELDFVLSRCQVMEKDKELDLEK